MVSRQSAYERPVAGAGGGQGDRHPEADHRIDGGQRPLVDEAHLAVIDPLGRLERRDQQGERHHEAGQDELGELVHSHDHRNRQQHDHHQRAREQQLERERLLEGQFLVGLLLLDVLVSHPHLLEP